MRLQSIFNHVISLSMPNMRWRLHNPRDAKGLGDLGWPLSGTPAHFVAQSFFLFDKRFGLTAPKSLSLQSLTFSLGLVLSFWSFSYFLAHIVGTYHFTSQPVPDNVRPISSPDELGGISHSEFLFASFFEQEVHSCIKIFRHNSHSQSREKVVLSYYIRVK